MGERVSATTARRVVVAAIVPMVAVTVWLAVSSEHLERPAASALYRSYLTAAPMAIGLLWWVRRPASSFGPLLVAFGILQWVVGWQFSDAPLPFDVGVLAEAPAFLLTFYLFLAFPMGRLEPAAARWLMVVLAVVAVGFFLPWALFSPVIAGGEPLTRCVAECPDNVLQIGTAPGVVEAAGKAETYSVLAIIVAVLVVYVLRVRAASRPRRRALMAVAVTSLLFQGHQRYTYELKPGSVQVPGATADAAVEKSLAAQGIPNATVNCPENIIVKVGTTVTCDVSGAEAIASGTVTFTFSDAEGTVDSSSVET